MPEAAAASQPQMGVMDQLKELAALRRAGVLTAEEFSITKAALLRHL